MQIKKFTKCAESRVSLSVKGNTKYRKGKGEDESDSEVDWNEMYQCECVGFTVL